MSKKRQAKEPGRRARLIVKRKRETKARKTSRRDQRQSLQMYAPAGLAIENP